jgi:hypothetical protein
MRGTTRRGAAITAVALVLLGATACSLQRGDDWSRLETVAQSFDAPESVKVLGIERHGAKCISQGCERPWVALLMSAPAVDEALCAEVGRAFNALSPADAGTASDGDLADCEPRDGFVDGHYVHLQVVSLDESAEGFLRQNKLVQPSEVAVVQFVVRSRP